MKNETAKIETIDLLETAGYSADQIKSGIDYADSIGWNSMEDLGQLAVSRILYSDSQLADGELVAW